jgi:hypothetical protein
MRLKKKDFMRHRADDWHLEFQGNNSLGAIHQRKRNRAPPVLELVRKAHRMVVYRTKTVRLKTLPLLHMNRNLVR